MKVFQVEYRIKKDIKFDWIKASTTTNAIKHLLQKIGKRETFYFKLLNVKQVIL